MKPTLTASVHLIQDLAEALPEIDADAGQIHQVIANLVLNAVEALDGHSGRVAIRTWVADWTEAELRPGLAIGIADPGRYVCLEVRDTGCGMDENTMRRIFDPFFSTKFTGRGLGLAAVAGIVRGHRGVVRVQSSPGHGSTVQVLFPCAPRAEAASLPARESMPAIRGATILVVDDEDLILRHAQSALDRHGHKTVVAASGEAAVEIFERNPSAFDLVLLDLSMPGLDGSATYDALVRLRRDVKVIAFSGYSEPEALRHFAGRQLAGFIQKPYRSAALAAKIEEVLS